MMQTYGKIFYLHAYPSKKAEARVANLTPYAKEREAQPHALPFVTKKTNAEFSQAAQQ